MYNLMAEKCDAVPADVLLAAVLSGEVPLGGLLSPFSVVCAQAACSRSWCRLWKDIRFTLPLRTAAQWVYTHQRELRCRPKLLEELGALLRVHASPLQRPRVVAVFWPLLPPRVAAQMLDAVQKQALPTDVEAILCSDHGVLRSLKPTSLDAAIYNHMLAYNGTQRVITIATEPFICQLPRSSNYVGWILGALEGLPTTVQLHIVALATGVYLCGCHAPSALRGPFTMPDDEPALAGTQDARADAGGCGRTASLG